MKKFLSSIMSVLVLSSAVSAVTMSYGSAAEEKISAELSEYMASSDAGSIPVWVTISDADKPDFDTLAEEAAAPKTEEEAEKYYSLSEDERTELIHRAKLDIVKNYYAEKNKALLAELDIPSDSVVFSSEMAPSMVLTLTKEQISVLDSSELVESLGLYDEEIPTIAPSDEKKLTKEEFMDALISETSDFSDGGFIYKGDLKFDAVPNGDTYDLIVYGIKEEHYTPNISVASGVLNFNTSDYNVAGVPAFYSGCFYSVKPDTNKAAAFDNDFTVIFYVENVLPGFPEPVNNIVEASINKPYDITPYIYPEITKGDIDNDGKIDSSDASLVLIAYSSSQTGKKMTLNYDLFDWNDDGAINSLDASYILQKYAENSTK